MKIPGIIIGTFALGASASVAGACDSAGCGTCPPAFFESMGNWLALAGAAIVGTVLFKKDWRSSVAKLGVVLMMLTFASSALAENKVTGDKGTAPMKVKVSELLEKPDQYVGKQVTVTARLADICTDDGCLTLKDKFDVIEGKPPGSGFKKNPKVGSTLNVTGVVGMKVKGTEKDVWIDVSKFEEAKK